MGLLEDRTKIRDIRDLEDGNAVDQVLLVRDSERRQTRTGADFMRLARADRTGVVTGLVWDGVENASATARPGDPVRVVGMFSQHPRYGPQLIVEALDIPLELDWDRLLDGPTTPAGELERQLAVLLGYPPRPSPRCADGRAARWRLEYRRPTRFDLRRSPPSTTVSIPPRVCSSTPFS